MKTLPSWRLQRWLPGLPELAQTHLTLLVALTPLCVYRWRLAHIYEPEVDLFEMSGGELQFWLPVGLIGAVLLRWMPKPGRPALAMLFQGVCFALLLLGAAELAFFEVTGTRTDWDALGFLVGDLDNALPVALSEVKAGQVLAAAFGAVLCSLPLRLRIPYDPAWGFVVGLPSLALVIWLPQGRTMFRGPLRELQPSLAEHLYWDGIDRIGDTTTPPEVADVQARKVERISDARPNIVLILLESVGWSATSLGGDVATTPNLARFAEHGLLAEHMYAVVPHTSKALVSTLCGDWPLLRTDIAEARPGGTPGRCLPELLRDLGYSTAFFQTANEDFESRTALVHQFGFQFFRGRGSFMTGPGGAKIVPINYFGIPDRHMVAPSVAWATRQQSPFFATYLTLATHHDYGTIPGWTYQTIPGKSGRQAKYLNNVRYIDDFVNRVVTGYQNANLAENTVFVVVGDHGEAFGEHNRWVHDMVIYEEGLHVPFLMWGAGIERGEIEGNRQQIDVLPTLVGVAGGQLSGSVRGSDLRAPVPDRVLRHSCWRSHRCLAQRSADRKKVIDHYNDGPMQLFDLHVDPFERTNLISETTDREARRAELRGWRSMVNGRYDEMVQRWLAHMQRPNDRPAQHSWPAMDMMGCTTTQNFAVPGQTFWLECAWRPPAEIVASLRVSVRFAGQLSHSRPLAGVWPTWKWIPGWTVADSVPIRVPDATVEGDFPIEVSWDGADWATVGTMPVMLD